MTLKSQSYHDAIIPLSDNADHRVVALAYIFAVSPASPNALLVGCDTRTALWKCAFSLPFIRLWGVLRSRTIDMILEQRRRNRDALRYGVSRFSGDPRQRYHLRYRCIIVGIGDSIYGVCSGMPGKSFHPRIWYWHHKVLTFR